MKQIFEQYALYNVWANQKMIDAILLLPEETSRQTVRSSFSSLQLTLLHMWNTESTWWQRLKLLETTQPVADAEVATREIAAGLIGQSLQWLAWVQKSNEPALMHEFIYRNSKKQQFKQPVYEMLLHLFNHATYHRGQLVTILRQLGVTTIPNTDFIAFSRGK